LAEQHRDKLIPTGKAPRVIFGFELLATSGTRCNSTSPNAVL
jgi:hypothetical protein